MPIASQALRATSSFRKKSKDEEVLNRNPDGSWTLREIRSGKGTGSGVSAQRCFLAPLENECSYSPFVKWLGIAILTAFSIALSLFMRLERSKPRQLPADIGQWGTTDARAPTDGAVDTANGEHIECRLWLYEGGWLRPHRLVAQRRIRGRGGKILRTFPERLVATWRGSYELVNEPNLDGR
jgi:hypothetical protein